jgi:glutamate/tyrosine decarboxylase-like PLP-dependent enzyme
MDDQATKHASGARSAPLDMDSEQFRDLGHLAVDMVADFLASVRERPVTPGEAPPDVRRLLGQGPLPESGGDPEALLAETARLLFDHSLLNGHPRFWGYITSSAAPIGALADLLASAVNPNVGAWVLSPIATEIEAQTVRWIAEMIGYPADCGGLLVGGGTAANTVGFLAARRARATWDIRGEGLQAGPRLVAYASDETHTWLQKAADLFGLGTSSVRWIPTDADCRMDVALLEEAIERDLLAGALPFLVVATAGSVSTGAVDPVRDIAEVCRKHNLWLHVDGAYGAFAAVLPDAPAGLKELHLADSVALDPHKWLYAPLDVGCVLVRDPEALPATYLYRPPYYHFEEEARDGGINYHQHGPDNSRAFRALKVWLALRQAGREGYARMISDDVALARALYERLEEYPELERLSNSLSITTFRYVPAGADRDSEASRDALNALNAQVLERLQRGGAAFVSNAVLAGRFALRACVVNFRTTLADVEMLPEIVVRIGREVGK